MPYKILVAEDDKAISELISMTMEIGKYETVRAEDGLEAKKVIQTQKLDLALLDVMLPGVDGYALLDELKKKNVPAIFVSAKTELPDKIHGLRMGAEDYISKPFEPLELLARVDTALRRLKPENDVVAIKDVTVDLSCRAVIKSGEKVALTPIEYDLLELFVRNPNLIFTRDRLLDKIWGYDYLGGTRTVDMHVQRLRTKLDFADVIVTVHRVGYRLEALT